MRWRVVLLVAAVAALPTIAAMPVEGRLDVLGVTFDAPAAGHLALHAFYANDTSRITRFDLVAQAVEVHVWRGEDVEARLPVGPLGGTTYRVSQGDARTLYTHARITLGAGDHAGWLGARWAPEADAELAPGGGVDFRAESVLGYTRNAALEPGSDGPEDEFFVEPLDAPHLFVDGARGLRLKGEGVVRLSGVDLDIDARENRTSLATGVARSPAKSVTTWVTLTFVNGTLDLGGLPDAQAQAMGASLAWTGDARLRQAEGALEGARSTWLPRADDETLTGAFRADLQPGEDRIRLGLAGDLDEATMATHARAPAPATGSVLPWLLGGVAAAVGGAVAFALHARRAPREATPEDLLELALQAAEAEDHDRALAWIRRARREAPGSERLALEEAAILEASGDEEAALDAYRGLAERTGNGEACWLLSRILARRGGHADDVAPWVVRAMERDPHLVFEVEDDEVLAPHVRRSDVRAAMQAARARLG